MDTYINVYGDILFLENLIMNYLILLVTARFTKNRTSTFRLFMGAMVGAAYVLILLLAPGLKYYYTTISKILLSVLIVAVSFSLDSIKTFLKTLAVFYISTFIFAGAAFAFLYFNQQGGFVRNGIVYVFWNSKWTVMFLAFSAITVGIIVRIFWEMVQYRVSKDKLLIPLTIRFESNVIGMEALIDTGNSLHDPLTNSPVIVVEFTAIKEVLPNEIKDIFEKSMDDDIISVTDIVSKTDWFSRFRLIPFKSLGKDNGMLIGFKPDYIEVGENENKKGLKDVIVGIYNRALSKNDMYKALLGPEIIG